MDSRPPAGGLTATKDGRMTWEYSVAGLLVGGFVGLTGMGGGSLVAPLLIVLFGVPALSAVGSGLLFAAVTQSVGGWQHARQQSVDLRLVAALAIGSVPASVTAAWAFGRALQSSPAVEEWLTRTIGTVLLLVAISLILRRLFWNPGGGDAAPARPAGWLLTSGGAVVGVLTGLTSIGSGSLTTALLSLSSHRQGRRLVGTVLVHATLLTFAAGLTHLAIGEVNLALTAALLVGSIPGVLLGSQATARIPAPHLQGAVAVGLLVLSIAILIPSFHTLLP